MKPYERQLRELRIPYPQKHDLERELSSLPNPSEFQEEDLREFYDLHNNFLHKILTTFSKEWRERTETTFILAPLFFLTIFIGKEKFMIQFIKEGGLGMLAILALTCPLIYRETLNLFRLFILKDHSAKNLHLDTASVQIGCLALLILGIAGTSMGIYYSASAVVSTGAHQSLFLAGVKESLGNLILSSACAGLVLVMHYTSRRLMIRWHAPIE